MTQLWQRAVAAKRRSYLQVPFPEREALFKRVISV